MAGNALRKTIRTTAAVALLASLGSPTAALAPAPELRRSPFARSHGPAARAWLAAERVYTEVASRARALDGRSRTRIARAVVGEAARAGVDPILVLAMIQVESAFDPRAVSRAGAVGLMQLLEPTMNEVAARAGLRAADPRDPVANVQAGIRHFATLVDAFDDTELALMAYNAGPTRIRRHLRAGGVPERFWTYPRKVNDEIRRLGGAIAPDVGPGDAALASRARPARRAIAPVSAHAGVRVASAGLVAGRMASRGRRAARSPHDRLGLSMCPEQSRADTIPEAPFATRRSPSGPELGGVRARGRSSRAIRAASRLASATMVTIGGRRAASGKAAAGKTLASHTRRFGTRVRISSSTTAPIAAPPPGCAPWIRVCPRPVAPASARMRRAIAAPSSSRARSRRVSGFEKDSSGETRPFASSVILVMIPSSRLDEPRARSGARSIIRPPGC